MNWTLSRKHKTKILFSTFYIILIKFILRFFLTSLSFMKKKQKSIISLLFFLVALSRLTFGVENQLLFNWVRLKFVMRSHSSSCNETKIKFVQRKSKTKRKKKIECVMWWSLSPVYCMVFLSASKRS